MINPGIYKAKVVSHGISETSKGDPQAYITFSYEDDGTNHSITWYGSFSEKAVPFTVKTLLICGLKGNNPAGELEINKEVSITIENEVGQDGKERTKVKWVNALNAVRNVIPNDLAKAKLSQLEGAVMLAKQKLGLSDDEFGF